MARANQNRHSKPLRLAILTCTGGAGHLRAAEGLLKAALDQPATFDPVCINVLDLTPPWFRRLYAESYIEMVQHAPELWGFLYHKSDAKPYRKNPLIKAFDRLNYEKFLAALKAHQPDALLCTHFLPYISLGPRLRERSFSPFIAAAVTDFDVHRLWVDPVVQRYYVFHEETAWQLSGLGVDNANICVSGIPLMPDFSKAAKRQALRSALEIPAEDVVILVLAGGFGVGRLPEIVTAVIASIASTKRRGTVVAIAGKNETLRTSVAKIPTPKGVALRSIGFTTSMHDWMGAADVVVTKSGGLTSAEALARRLPMVIIDPIPGQESRNADLIIAHGAGIKAINSHHLQYVLGGLIDDPRRRAAMGRAGARLGKPNAARTILSDLRTALRLTP